MSSQQLALANNNNENAKPVAAITNTRRRSGTGETLPKVNNSLEVPINPVSK
jgi:hypothetical protein